MAAAWGATEEVSSSLYPNPTSSARKYDVFLSFSGADTRKRFTSHLLASMERNGFRTFRDDRELERGEDIGAELMKAIEESRVSLVVLSKSYALSRWCLDELVKIIESKKKFQQKVVPIFYEIKPSEVRHQSGSIEEALDEHIVSSSRMEKWKAALTDVAQLSGFVLQSMVDRDEASFVELIVEEVERQLNRTIRLHVADHSVGIISRLQKLHKLLSMESSNDVRIVAIWGIGGSGKTTIAKAAYNHVYCQFEGSSFVADVRQTSQQPNGLFLLQKQILSNILRKENCSIQNSHEGIEFIKRRAFCGRRILLVLDDVDDVQQLKALAIDPKFLHSGSRIILTTRDISSLGSLRLVAEVYTPELLNKDESLQLFSWHAFQKDHPLEDYVNLSIEVVNYAGGVPLALEVLGSFLFDKTKSEWRSAIIKLKKIPHDDVVGKLKISFDSLNKEEKDLFLDIACFFAGMSRDFTIRVLEGCNFFPEIGIRSLADHCLIKYEFGKEIGYESRCMYQIMMHDLLRDMGREIVRQESIKDTSRRSRLWDHDDVLEMLRHGEGTEAIEGLILSSSEVEDRKVNAEVFKKMDKLRILHLDHVHLSSGYEHLSKRLVWLRWHGFCLKFVPSQLCMENLVALDLSHSMIRQVWRGTKTLGKLKFLYLSHCYYLTTTPDFSTLSNIEELFLDNCIRLLEVDDSIRYLHKLVILNLASCKNLRKLPSGSWMLNAKILNLSGCSKLEHFAQVQELRSKSRCAWLSCLALRTKSMGFLSLNSVQGLRCLKLCRIANCNLSYIPAEIGKLIHLECLDLVGNNFCSLPESISDLTNLVHLNLSYCERLRSLPRLSAGIRVLEVQNCTSLESISLESDWQDADMFLYNCPKLDQTHYADDLERSLLMSMKPGSLSMSHSGDMFMNWLEYQNTGPRISFVVPPLIHQNLIGLIFCIVYTIEEYFWGVGCTMHNKTKGIQFVYDQCLSAKLVGGIHFGDNTVLGYVSLGPKSVELQTGDEVEISLHKVLVKKVGIHPIYKADV